jgi:predicted Rossmann fold nucleotide-binding protein DprA/Smf involved in DNA uptake
MAENATAEKVVSKPEEIRNEIESRLKEIREAVAPQIEEESALVSMHPEEKVHFSLASSEPEAKPQAASAEPAKPSAASNGSSAPRRRNRQGGTRAEQAVKLIEEKPGISASDVAKEMGIAPNYLYRVLGDLEKEGKVKKDGRSYEVVASK